MSRDADLTSLLAENAALRAEVERLREQLARVTAQVEPPTRTPAPSRADHRGEPLLARPAQPSTIALPVVRPGDSGSGLPLVDRTSSEVDKLALFRTLFAGRQDVYAYPWENRTTGEKGWAPKRRPGSRKEDHDFLPLTDAVLEDHLRDNPTTVGLYVMLPDSTCRLLVCDFDDATWRLDCAAYAQVADAAGVPTAVEVSRSGEGAHVWTFFTEPVPAADARALGAALLREAMAVRGELGLDSYDRMFPSQDFIPRRGLGNLVTLPLQGRCRWHSNTTLFVDPHTLQPYPDQFASLSSMARMDRRQLVETVERLQPPVVGPATRLRRSPLAAEPAPPEVIRAELAGMLAIRRAGLPPGLLATLKHLASLHNAEFHDKQRMGFSVWNTPRFLRCYLETLEHLYLPRGVVDEARYIVAEAGARLQITDVRPDPAPARFTFTGTPRDDAQRRAIDALAGHAMGVLVAPPGAGKTVMACALIAHHATPTLVLMDRAPLLKQWQDRLATFLGLDRQQIGQIGGGKSRRTGVVDLVMLQTLARHDDPATLLDGYGLVVVDECHHVAAETFEAAIRDIPARRWLGLTATPKRTDHRDQIMLMHCGPIRHRVTATPDLVLRLVVHPTGFTLRDDIDSETTGLFTSITVPALVADVERNTQICGDVTEAVRSGRNCLVLTGRTDHVDVLTKGLRGRGLHPVTLHGGLKPKQRLTALDALADPRHGQPPLVVVATDRYIGEGFDCPRLDTVFLTYPLSSESPLTQYVGRILREHPGKTEATVHDYADTKVPMLGRMHGKRLTIYRRLGFSAGPVQTRLPRPAAADAAARSDPPAAVVAQPPEPRALDRPTERVSAAQIRAWARAAGHDVADRGRLSAEIVLAYNQAHRANP